MTPYLPKEKKGCVFVKRNCGMMLRFTRSEIDALTKKARKSGLSREGFCRAVLNGAEVKPVPDADTGTLLLNIRRNGSELNRLLKQAERSTLDLPQLRKAAEETAAAARAVIDAYS